MLHRALEGVAILRVLVFDDHHRNAIDEEHHVGPVALARRRLDLPFPGHLEVILRDVLEVDDHHRPMAFLGLVVPLALAPQPGQQFTVALDGGRQRVQRLDDRTRRIRRQPGIELHDLLLQHATKQAGGLVTPQVHGLDGREWGPADLGGMIHHRELNRAGFADLERHG